MLRLTVIVAILLGLVGHVQAQTETPTPMPTYTSTPTLTPEPYIYATLLPEATDEAGQMTRFDYVATAGDVHIANLLTAQLFSVWVLIILLVLVLWGRRNR